MKIFFDSSDNILKRIEERKVNVCVIGIGTVGLPLATYLAKEGFKVFGLDINQEKVDKVNQGNFIFEYSEMLKEVVSESKLIATTSAEEAIPESDVIFICVPTPIHENKEINLSYLQAAGKSIIDNFQKGILIVVESSISVGVTRNLGRDIEKATSCKMGQDFGLAYCPERYNPTLPKERLPSVVYKSEEKDESEKFYTLDKIARVIGAVDKKSLFITKNLYSQIIKKELVEVSSMEVAEATKLFENIFRDVNIALVNELSTVFTKIGLDTFEVIKAAKTKPFSFLAHYPGLVGGECIPVDTWYLIKQAEKVGIDTRLLKVAREANDAMAQHVFSLLTNAFGSVKRDIKGSNICILGLAYKKNIPDMRNSLSMIIASLLEEKGAKLFLCDPVMEKAKRDVKNLKNLTSLDKAFDEMDAIIMATDHDIFHTITLEEIKEKMRTPVIIDARNFYNKEEAEAKEFTYRGIGKPIK